ncbi:MAG TPA: hypothetical protein VJO36_10070 [Actinomycetota bacterium]|nr:hypothetical protein [Actinomycetota bacterium]
MEPSKDRGFEYRPCQVVLRTGEVVDRVYVSDARSYINRSGSWPWEATGVLYIPIAEISEIRPSPSRIPARFANEMYRAGESGMGYFVYTLVLRDGRRLPYVTGAVDFPNLPRGVSPAHIVDLLPHVGRSELQPEGHWTDDPHQQGADYHWSLYRT